LLDGAVVNASLWSLYPRNKTFFQTTGWASGPVWTGAENFFIHRDFFVSEIFILFSLFTFSVFVSSL
jgi:hypothetical protein